MRSLKWYIRPKPEPDLMDLFIHSRGKEFWGMQMRFGQTLAFLMVLALLQLRCASLPSSDTASADAVSASTMHRGQGMDVIELMSPPSVGKNERGDEIYLGGFSGLLFEGRDEKTGELSFLTHTDRGPNGEEIPAADGNGKVIPFPIPQFQPEWIRLRYQPASRHLNVAQLTVAKRVPLSRVDGLPLTGLPNRPGSALQAGFDERAVDARGAPLKPDPIGLDLEGIVALPDGRYAMVEEYRPSILFFSGEGRLLERFVPDSGRKDAGTFGTPVLPGHFDHRRGNRGFEAIAYHQGKIYAFLQSPLDYPPTDDDRSSKSSQAVRVLEFDVSKKVPTGEYLYWLDDAKSDRKLGDAVALPNGEFLVLEQTSKTGANADKKLYRVSLRGASNLILEKSGKQARETLETMTVDSLSQKKIQPVRKELVEDLAKRGLDFAGKIEGLALVDAETVVLASDNDFQLKQKEPSRLIFMKINKLY